MKQKVSRCETLRFSVRNKQFQGMKQLARLKGLKKSSCLKRKISTDKK
ncbi:hypothetical protein BN890_30570 [Bacteroides xylanisolvens SD CC 1b]|uniref:Uncharacterized protein n=1 Tax=Bacteroides xylanisolvens SD CC 1b TaxID=702447 RepID=W6PCA3_9BACE|nr:hypothetical protein BN891_34130 [Bacteroides xylanisolvens SD CC 2a]CDM05467.1 hypothetical protein BN890_30570 [Bacteroides xylanisolvens SD CC 1b]